MATKKEEIEVKVANDDTRIEKVDQVLPPIALLEKFPASEEAADLVHETRLHAHNIIHGKDDRLLVVIGPCSIHDPKAALDYAKRLKVLRDEYKDTLEVVMRVYFEKPRTTVGWKGLINDPYLNDTYRLNDGLRIARKLLSDINNLGVPSAGEFLDMITPQYVADFMSWGAIGARTTESQVHRELASGLSCAVGFKNGTNGGVKVALDAMGAAEASHYFLSVTKFGHSAIVSTKGNEDCHIIYVVGIKVLTIKQKTLQKFVQRSKNQVVFHMSWLILAMQIVANNSKNKWMFVKMFASKLQVVQSRSSVSW